MRLVFYSGGDHLFNRSLDEKLMEMLGKKDPLISFIPVSAYESEVDFSLFIKQYRYFGIKRFLHFPVDIPFDSVLEKEVFKSDIIHLGGGNTFYFLRHLKKSGMFKKLQSFVKDGGILTGLSAGAIMMTSDIETASFPSFDCDDNDLHLKNLKALSLVNFHIFPHYKNSKRYHTEMENYTRRKNTTLYALFDGSGIVIDGEKKEFVGKIIEFINGKKKLIF